MRIYSVSFENVTISSAASAQDLFEIRPAASKPCSLVGLFLSKSDGDPTVEELLRLAVIIGHATSGSGGSTETPEPTRAAYGAAGFAAEINNTTIASGGAPRLLHADGWNTRVPWSMLWPDFYPTDASMAPQAKSTDTTMVARLMAAPAADVVANGVVYVLEEDE